MWLLLSSMSLAEKTDGELPVFADSQPVISCCVDREIIDGAVREKMDEIRACHTPTPGRGKLRWTVEPSSTIVEVTVETGDAERDACLTAVIETLSFPVLPCRLTVTYPLVFSGP